MGHDYCEGCSREVPVSCLHLVEETDEYLCATCLTTRVEMACAGVSA